MRDPNRGFARDPRPTVELIGLLRTDPDYLENLHGALMALHLRGGEEEYAAAEALSRSDLPRDRVLAADILAQLGAGEPTFVAESVALLLGMLSDPDERVLRTVGVALGHRGSAAAIPALLPLRSHAIADVRFGVAFGLVGHEHPDAIAALIELSRDPDRDVRDRATFGLGQMTETDTPDLRAALLVRAEDDDPEVRGEALIGLAARRDPCVLPALRRELAGEFFGDWCVEAAELLGDASLRDALAALRARLEPENEAAFGRGFERALRACSSASASDRPLPMAAVRPRVLALDLEGTLISSAVSQFPRPGLRPFLDWALATFPRVVVFTSVRAEVARAVLATLVEYGDAPAAAADLEVVSWSGPVKDLAFVEGARTEEVLLVDDQERVVAPARSRAGRSASPASTAGSGFDDPRAHDAP